MATSGNGDLRRKVLRDIHRKVDRTEQVDFTMIVSTNGAHDTVLVQRLRTAEFIERELKLIATGVDQVANPRDHLAMILHPQEQAGTSKVLLVDRRWTAPKVFARPNVPVSR